MKLLRLIIIALILVIAAWAALLYIGKQYPAPKVAETFHQILQPTPQPSVTSANGQTTFATTTPKTLLLNVPFTPQAPTANWDKIHNEDCEEASAIMANSFYNGPHDTKLDSGYVEGQLTKLTDWEMQNFGYNLDVSSEEVVKMIQANYNLQTKILYNYTEASVKSELAQNHLVLIPENGQLLGNPNYKQPGPPYHMLVIRGYTPDNIITNDPGTHNGLNYSYTFDTLYNANGDYDHSKNSVNLNKKNAIIVWR